METIVCKLASNCKEYAKKDRRISKEINLTNLSKSELTLSKRDSQDSDSFPFSESFFK